MELIGTKGKSSFDPTPKLKSNPVPILFFPFNGEKDCCDCCASIYSKTPSRQKYCKNCLFDYLNNLIDNNIYLDAIYTNNFLCKEHKSQNFQEWCNNCSEI